MIISLLIYLVRWIKIGARCVLKSKKVLSLFKKWILLALFVSMPAAAGRITSFSIGYPVSHWELTFGVTNRRSVNFLSSRIQIGWLPIVTGLTTSRTLTLTSSIISQLPCHVFVLLYALRMNYEWSLI